MDSGRPFSLLSPNSVACQKTSGRRNFLVIDAQMAMVEWREIVRPDDLAWISTWSESLIHDELYRNVDRWTEHLDY